jgi:hypothetical protein
LAFLSTILPSSTRKRVGLEGKTKQNVPRKRMENKMTRKTDKKILKI